MTVRLSLSQAINLKGYGLTLQYDPAKYEHLEAREPDGNLLASGSTRKTLFLTSNRTPGELNIGAVRVDGQGATGEGMLVALVFKTSGTPSSSDFQVSECVLVGVDGAVDLLARVEIGNLQPLPDQYGLNRNAPNPFNPATVIGYQLPEAGLVTFDRLRPEEQRRTDLANRRFSNLPDVIGEKRICARCQLLVFNKPKLKPNGVCGSSPVLACGSAARNRSRRKACVN